MPIHAHAIRWGTRSKRLFVFARTPSAVSTGATGLRPDDDGASAAFIRDADVEATEVALVAGRLGSYHPGAFVEVDAGLMPGLYQFGAPDAMFAEGATRVLLLLRFPGAVIDPVEIDLVAYDPHDPDRLGMESLGSSRRHQFLRRALPRLTERELSLGTPGEAELSRRRSQTE